MKFNRCIAVIAIVFLIAVSNLTTADVLPNGGAENQVIRAGSIIELVGPLTEKTTAVWHIGDAGIEELKYAAGAVEGDVSSSSIAYSTYSDFIATNGGQISEVKSFSMDTEAKTEGLNNIETTKVLTYNSQNGSHLRGEESYLLSVAGNWSQEFNGTSSACIFSREGGVRKTIPAFCNKATASSKLSSVTTAQVQTRGALVAVGNTTATLNYEISVTPDANSASGYADGIVSTTFTVSIMEGQTDGVISQATRGWLNWRVDYVNLESFDKLRSVLTGIDTATVTGGISRFNKVFSYQSGLACMNC